MRTGFFPGREEAIRARIAEIRDEERRLGSRRLFIGAAVAGLVGAAGGAGLDRLVSHDTAQGEERLAGDADLEWARDLARGPLSDLLHVQVTFVMGVMHARQVDDALWLGVMRLCGACVERDPACKPALDQLLLQLRNRPDLPSTVATWLDLVHSRSR